MTAATTVAAGAAVDAPATALYGRVSERAAFLDVGISPEELADLAVRLDMGEDELSALEAVFTYLADKRRDQVISTLLKLSRLPQRAPKTFEGFDFDRIRGRDAAALRKLPALYKPARTEEPGVHRTRWNWEDPPCASLRQGVLPGGLQDVLPQGDRAPGQAEESRGFRQHLESGGRARQALVPDHRRGRALHLRQAVHGFVLRHSGPALREGGPEHDDSDEQHVHE